jgi:hypothetical protein
VTSTFLAQLRLEVFLRSIWSSTHNATRLVFGSRSSAIHTVLQLPFALPARDVPHLGCLPLRPSALGSRPHRLYFDNGGRSVNLCADCLTLSNGTNQGCHTAQIATAATFPGSRITCNDGGMIAVVPNAFVGCPTPGVAWRYLTNKKGSNVWCLSRSPDVLSIAVDTLLQSLHPLEENRVQCLARDFCQIT